MRLPASSTLRILHGLGTQSQLLNASLALVQARDQALQSTHAAVVCWWPAGALFHCSFESSFGGWARSPFHHAPTLRPFWDPHAFDAARQVGAGGGAGGGWLELTSSDAYNSLLSVGFASEAGALTFTAALSLLALSFMVVPPSVKGFNRRAAPLAVGALGAAAGHTHATSSCCLLSFSGALDPYTSALLPGDVINQHLGAGALLLWGRMLAARGAPLHARAARPWNFRLRFLLAALGSLSSAAAQHAAAMPAFLFVAHLTLLFAHHTCAGGPFSLGAASHAAIFLDRARPARGAAFSPGRGAAGNLSAAAANTLSWVSLWLGFHVLGVFAHNDSASAASWAAHQLLFRPALAESLHPAACSSRASLFSDLGPGDFLAHHAIALGLHTSALVLAKGAAGARASRHMPDKAAHGFGFACDGPGRGGSCDISGWDSAYLAVFWVLNTLAWTLFYAHYAHWAGGGAFLESSPALMGWFRDYLWYSCSALVRGYGLLGADEAAPAAWAFLLAHLCWAAGPMPLASWRGYWQEVIEILAYMHLRSPALSSLWAARVSPVALSIVQARAAGLAHFGAGFLATYYCFLV